MDVAVSLDVLLRRANHQHIKQVMVGGRWVVRDSRSQTLDERTIVEALLQELVKQDKTLLQEAAVAQTTLATYLRQFYAQWDLVSSRQGSIFRSQE
ncbi:MAG TPA: hypothetical protein V6C95_02790 [Coleofasciculaceae cyanobacterium]